MKTTRQLTDSFLHNCRRIGFGNIFLAFLLLGFTACDENDDGDLNDTSATADISAESVADLENDVDFNSADEDLELVVEDAMAVVDDDVLAGGRVAQDSLDEDSKIRCAEVTHDLENKTIIIDYGDGCEGPRGRIRKGKIIITYTARRRVPGSIVTYTLEDFSIDELQIEGTKTVTNLTSSEDASTVIFNVVLENGRMTWPDGTFATREYDRTRTWERHEDRFEDEYYVEGEAHGITRRGREYTVTILERIVFRRDCHRGRIFIPVAGVKVISHPGEEDLIIDYGDGRCDNIVTLTKGDRSKEIRVNPRRFLG